MPGNGGLGHFEGLCQLHHRRFAKGKPGENGASGGVGECSESGIKVCITYTLYNINYIYNLRVIVKLDF